MDELFKTTIAILNTMGDAYEISKYSDMMKHQASCQLSDVSVENLKSSLILHSIALAQRELYLLTIKDAKFDLENYNVPESMLIEVGTFIDETIANLRVTEYYIEDNLNLEYQTLDIFEPNSEEVSLNIKSSEDTNPTYLNFFTSRMFAIKNANILKRFTDFKLSLSDISESMKQTVVTRNNTISILIAENLLFMISYYNELKMLSEASLLALLVYETYQLEGLSTARLFTNRGFSSIKKDLEALVI